MWHFGCHQNSINLPFLRLPMATPMEVDDESDRHACEQTDPKGFYCALLSLYISAKAQHLCFMVISIT